MKNYIRSQIILALSWRWSREDHIQCQLQWWKMPGLHSRDIRDRTRYNFEVFGNSVEGQYGQVGAGYLFDVSFQDACLQKGVDCCIDFLGEVWDACALYGELLIACKSDVRCRILMENRSSHKMVSCHGINWSSIIKQMETDMIGLRNWKMSLLQYFNVIIKVDCLNGYKTMKMPSKRLFYFARRLGMMMRWRNVIPCKMLRLLDW
jgi:hypothetical protein